MTPNELRNITDIFMYDPQISYHQFGFTRNFKAPGLKRLRLFQTTVGAPPEKMEQIEELALVHYELPSLTSWNVTLRLWLDQLPRLKTLAIHSFSNCFLDPYGTIILLAAKCVSRTLETLHVFSASRPIQRDGPTETELASLNHFERLKNLSVLWNDLVNTDVVVACNACRTTRLPQIYNLPPSLQKLRLFIRLETVLGSNFGISGVQMLIYFITNQTCRNLKLFEIVFVTIKRRINKQLFLTRNMPALRELCANRGIQFAIYSRNSESGKAMEPLPNFAGQPWNYVHSLSPEFQRLAISDLGVSIPDDLRKLRCQ
jgi:hypothetical protein